MWNKIRPSIVITRREMRDHFRDWRIVLPLILLTTVFPFVLNFTAQQTLGFIQSTGANLVADRIIPLLLMIVGFFPVTVSLVLALESFVGEKERGSIEPLLNSPVTDWQLFLGKLLSATFPPILAGVLGMGVYLFGLSLSNTTLPGKELVIQLILLNIGQAFVMVSGAVVVSTQATSVRSANLLAAFIFIPAALLIQVETLIIFWGSFETLWWILFGLFVLAILLIRIGLAYFQREELLSPSGDSFNLPRVWQIFKTALVEDARSLGDWYVRIIAAGLRRLSFPLFLAFILVVLGILLGMTQVEEIPIAISPLGMQSIESRLGGLLDFWPVFSIEPVVSIWWQNVRVVLISLVLGILTFGVFGMIPLLASMGLTGYLLEVMAQNGISPWKYLFGFILPHGVFEITALIIACAAILRMGAVLATPKSGKKVGEVWLVAFADWVKVMIGLVIPMLFIAASIEVWVTPRLAMLLMR